MQDVTQTHTHTPSPHLPFIPQSKERAATAIADNSDAARKIKDAFRSKMATYIVSVLNPYRRGDCREGKITCTEDFKYLARKVRHQAPPPPPAGGDVWKDSVRQKLIQH